MLSALFSFLIGAAQWAASAGALAAFFGFAWAWLPAAWANAPWKAPWRSERAGEAAMHSGDVSLGHLAVTGYAFLSYVAAVLTFTTAYAAKIASTDASPALGDILIGILAAAAAATAAVGGGVKALRRARALRRATKERAAHMKEKHAPRSSEERAQARSDAQVPPAAHAPAGESAGQ